MLLDFGFYPRHFDHGFGDITISTLPELEAKVAMVCGNERVRNKYFCAAPSARIFSMLKTHSIEHASAQLVATADVSVATREARNDAHERSGHGLLFILRSGRSEQPTLTG